AGREAIPAIAPLFLQASPKKKSLLHSLVEPVGAGHLKPLLNCPTPANASSRQDRMPYAHAEYGQDFRPTISLRLRPGQVLFQIGARWPKVRPDYVHFVVARRAVALPRHRARNSSAKPGKPIRRSR